MYNLFVSGWEDAWQGKPQDFEISRCVREYTDNDIREKFSDLNANAIADLKKLPCIFAYESGHQLDPKFGILLDIVKRGNTVRVEYEIHEINPFLSHSDFDELSFELDLGHWEMNRTHWAVKNVNLPKELRGRGISLPSWTQSISRAVDVSVHRFAVALSFPGEAREFVEGVAFELERRLGPDAYFYDNNYTAQLARPSLDTFLQDIYKNRSRLIVVFVGADYQRKDWCGVEFRAIRDIISARENERVMFIKMDDGLVEGVFRNDGYVEAKRYGPQGIARLICERLPFVPE